MEKERAPNTVMSKLGSPRDRFRGWDSHLQTVSSSPGCLPVTVMNGQLTNRSCQMHRKFAERLLWTLMRPKSFTTASNALSSMLTGLLAQFWTTEPNGIELLWCCAHLKPVAWQRAETLAAALVAVERLEPWTPWKRRKQRPGRVLTTQLLSDGDPAAFTF